MEDRGQSKKTTIIYTSLFFFNHFIYGIASNLIWPALVDLRFIYGVSSETINYLSLYCSLGYLIGSLSGFLYKWISKQLYLTFMLMVLAITVAFVPFYGDYLWLSIALTLSSIGGGSWDSSNGVWLVEMVKNQGSAMQALQFMYGAGLIISPLVVAPFVYGLNNSTDITSEKRQHSLAIPFGFGGLIQATVPVMLLVLYFVMPYRRPKYCDNNNDDHQPVIGDTENYSDVQQQQQEPVAQLRSRSWRKTKLLLGALMLAVYSATESAYFSYASTMYQHSEPRLSATEAAHVLAVLSASFTIGRLLTAFIALKLEPDIIILYHLAILISSQTLLYFTKHLTCMIYVTNVFLGYGYSAMWPAIVSFIEKHFKLTDHNCTLIFMSAGLFPLITPFLIGGCLDTKPEVLIIFEAIYTIGCILVFTIVKSFIYLTR